MSEEQVAAIMRAAGLNDWQPHQLIDRHFSFSYTENVEEDVSVQVNAYGKILGVVVTGSNMSVLKLHVSVPDGFVATIKHLMFSVHVGWTIQIDLGGIDDVPGKFRLLT